MRIPFTLILLLAVTLNVGGQPAEEFKTMKAKHTDQPAVYEERSEAIEILYSKKEGLSFTSSTRQQLFILAENALPFAPGAEYFSKSYNIEKIKAYTLVPETKGYKEMAVKDFKKSSEISDDVFFDDQQAYKYTFPAVCQGAKLVEEVTYRYTKPETPMIFFFGLNLPTTSAKFSITFPDNVKINYKLFGLDTANVRLTKTLKGKKWIYVWEATNMNSIPDESNAPNSRYYIPHIIVNVANYTSESGNVQVIGSLADFYKLNYSRIKEVNKTIDPEIKSLADSLTAGIANEQDKVDRIFSWVQKNIRYVAIEDGDNGVVPREAILVLHRRYGDCKDKTSILQAMISAIGADVSFAWIGTRLLPYKYSEFPSTVADNHMIAVYRTSQGKVYFLDGTTLYHTMGFPPTGIQGKECLVARGADKFDVITVPVSTPETNSVTDSVWVEVKHDTLIGKGCAYICGESKSNLINAFLNSSKEDYQLVFSRFLPKANNKFRITSIEVSNLEKIADTLKVSYTFAFPDYISLRGNNYYINLNVDRVLQNESVKPDRTIPIEFDFPIKYTTICTLKPIVGYGKPLLPGKNNFADNSFSYNIAYEQKNGCIALTKQIISNELLLYPKSFESYRQMLGNLNAAYMQTLVFRKN